MPEQNEGYHPSEGEIGKPEEGTPEPIDDSGRREISEAEKRDRLALFRRLGKLMLDAEESYDNQLFEDLRKVHSDYRDRLRKDGIDYMK